jgi:hypothetical protein
MKKQRFLHRVARQYAIQEIDPDRRWRLYFGHRSAKWLGTKSIDENP